MVPSSLPTRNKWGAIGLNPMAVPEPAITRQGGGVTGFSEHAHSLMAMFCVPSGPCTLLVAITSCTVS